MIIHSQQYLPNCLITNVTESGSAPPVQNLTDVLVILFISTITYEFYIIAMTRYSSPAASLHGRISDGQYCLVESQEDDSNPQDEMRSSSDLDRNNVSTPSKVENID
jgi:hypothetical protein